MTNKFNGERLRQARMYNKISINDLAELLNVSKQAISQYETQNITPDFNKMRIIVDKLNFPSSYFFQEDMYDIKPSTTYFRALLSANRGERNQQDIKIRHLAVIHNILDKYVEFPSLNLPIIPEELKANLTKENIEKIAQIVREYWNLGDKPINDIIYVLEKNGIIVTAYGTENNIDAYSKKIKINNKDSYIIVLSTTKESAVRSNFDAAHELGHIILHDWNTNLEDLTSKEFKEIEQQANDFAAAFLLPPDTFGKEVSFAPNNINCYVDLKKKWKVSILAMIIRANRLGLLDDAHYQNNVKRLSAKGWRSREPLDDILTKAQPTLLQKSIDLLFENDVFDADSFLEELKENHISMNPDEVEHLLHLTKGKLSTKKQEEQSVGLKLKCITKTSN